MVIFHSYVKLPEGKFHENSAPSSPRDEVVSLWKPFSQLLLNNVDTIRDASGHLGPNR